ncbi:MAG TPA: helix-turn-helix transcriptional regulator [Streptosporangiaceae bacterium]|jgi:transcriptional regulator with XRE-family HTH domain
MVPGEVVGVGERSSPVLLRWVLGEWLREIRDACGLTGSDVARQLGWAPSKVSRIENHEGVSPGDVRELLDIYGITSPDDVRPLVAMARQAQQRGWWYGYGDVMPSWFATFVGLETGAAEERDYKGALVTGLLQTPDYARAVMGADAPGGPPPPGELERLIALRLERQQLLYQAADPLRLWAVLDEAVLRRNVGGPAVMRQQLRHLAEISAAPNITIQVLPGDRVHPALDFPFCLLLFRDQRRIPGLVYLENFRKTLYLETGGDMQYYSAVFDELTRAALSPEQSRAAIAGHLKALDA